MKAHVACTAGLVGALVLGGCGGQVILGSGDDGGGDGAGGDDSGFGFDGAGDDGGVVFGSDGGFDAGDGGQSEGAPSDAGWSPGPLASSYNAALVENARQLCDLSDPAATDDVYTVADIQSHLVGAWMLCTYSDLTDAVSYEFTADGQWETLQPDVNGNLAAGQPGVDGAPSEMGSYALLDQQGNPAGSGTSIVYLGRDGTTWFHPEFALGPRRLWMYVATTGSVESYVQLGQ